MGGFGNAYSLLVTVVRRDYENFDSQMQGFFVNLDSLGARLRTARKALSKSQDDMAAACGVSREMWGKYERNAAVPGGEVLIKVALAGADVLYILTGQRTEGAASDPAEQVLLDSYRRCKPDAKANLIQTAALLSAGISTGATTTAAAPRKAAGGMNMSNLGDGNVQIGSISGSYNAELPRTTRKPKTK